MRGWARSGTSKNETRLKVRVFHGMEQKLNKQLLYEKKMYVSTPNGRRWMKNIWGYLDFSNFEQFGHY